MTKPRPTRGQPGGSAGIKAAIGAAALAATLGGWAVLAAQEEQQTATTAPVIELAPMPTVMPPPGVVTGGQQPAPAQLQPAVRPAPLTTTSSSR